VLPYMVCHGSHQYTTNDVSIYTSTMDLSWLIFETLRNYEKDEKMLE
jgi:hypothetical protein